MDLLENHPMITDPFQRKAYDAVSAALPFAIDPAKITVEPGVSYLPSPIKLHDYAAGVMAAFGSVVENLGRVRGLPAQTMTLNRRLAALAEREERGAAWRVDAIAHPYFDVRQRARWVRSTRNPMRRSPCRT
jgi:hypothetical protein